MISDMIHWCRKYAQPVVCGMQYIHRAPDWERKHSLPYIRNVRSIDVNSIKLKGRIENEERECT